MTSPFLPFNKPCFEGKELIYIADAINRGHISGDGYYTKKCSEFSDTAAEVVNGSFLIME